MNSTFTQLDTRTDQLFTAIQAGLVQPDSDVMNELAGLMVTLEDAPVKPVVLARLTLTRANGWKTIVEVEAGSTFSSFFKYYKQFKNKRSTKEHIRTANRNDGGISWPRLETIAEKLSTFQSMSNPVTRTTIRIFNHRAFAQLLSARPDELGLTKTIVGVSLRSTHRGSHVN